MSPVATTILLVEDDPSLQASLKDFLGDHGYQTHAVGTRAAGAEAIRRLRPAICLLDMNLPDGSGADLLRLIVAENLGVQTIVMTAMPVEHLNGRYPKSVLAAVMTKPVSPEDLLRAVDTIVRGPSTPHDREG